MTDAPTQTCDQPVYVLLMRLTDRGALEEAPADRLAEALGAVEKLGGRIESVDVVLGEFDYVVRCAGLDHPAMVRLAHFIARTGMFRTTTLAGSPKECLYSLQQPITPPIPTGRYHT